MALARTLDGAEMIVLTRQEYDALIEDAGDTALIADAKADARTKATMDSAYVLASLDGSMHPLTAWRKSAGLTIAALGDVADVRAATISDLENGKLDPRWSTLSRLAKALRVDVDDIMPSDDQTG